MTLTEQERDREKAIGTAATKGEIRRALDTAQRLRDAASLQNKEAEILEARVQGFDEATGRKRLRVAQREARDEDGKKSFTFTVVLPISGNIVEQVTVILRARDVGGTGSDADERKFLYAISRALADLYDVPLSNVKVTDEGR